MEYYSDFEDEEDFMEIDSKPSPSPPPPPGHQSAAEGKASVPPIDANPLWINNLRSFRALIRSASGSSTHHRPNDWYIDPSPRPARDFRQDLLLARTGLADESVDNMLCHDCQAIARDRE